MGGAQSKVEARVMSRALKMLTDPKWFERQERRFDAVIRCANRLMPIKDAAAAFSTAGRRLSQDDLLAALHLARARIFILRTNTVTSLERYELPDSGAQLDFGWYFEETAKDAQDITNLRDGLLVRPDDVACALCGAGYELPPKGLALVAKRKARPILRECRQAMIQAETEAKSKSLTGWKPSDCLRPTGKELDILHHGAGLAMDKIASTVLGMSYRVYRETQSQAGGKRKDPAGRPVTTLSGALARRLEAYTKSK